MAECQKSYEALLASAGVISADSSPNTAMESATGTIATMVEAVIEGNSHFYVTLEGDDRIFDCALPSMLPIVTYAVGDEVTFEFTSGESTCTVTSVGGTVVRTEDGAQAQGESQPQGETSAQQANEAPSAGGEGQQA